MDTKKIAVIFPGMGYHKDKPLLYYSGKILKGLGYEIINVEYRDLPRTDSDDLAKRREAGEVAYAQAEELLDNIVFEGYDRVVFVGKSIGTIIAARFAAEHGVQALQLWYTPLEATYSFKAENAVAFIGDKDPWSDVEKLKKTSYEHGIEIYSYAEANHSLETEDVLNSVDIIKDVMTKTTEFLRQYD